MRIGSVSSVMSADRLLSHRQGSIFLFCNLGNTFLGSLLGTLYRNIHKYAVSAQSHIALVVGGLALSDYDRKNRVLSQTADCTFRTSAVLHRVWCDVPAILLFRHAHYSPHNVDKCSYLSQELYGRTVGIREFGSPLFAQTLSHLSNSDGSVLFRASSFLPHLQPIWRLLQVSVSSQLVSQLMRWISFALFQWTVLVQRSICSLCEYTRTSLVRRVAWLRYCVNLSKLLGSDLSRTVFRALCKVFHTAHNFFHGFLAYLYYTMFVWEVQVLDD